MFFAVSVAGANSKKSGRRLWFAALNLYICWHAIKPQNHTSSGRIYDRVTFFLFEITIETKERAQKNKPGLQDATHKLTSIAII